MHMFIYCINACVCVCVCECARARACVYIYMCSSSDVARRKFCACGGLALLESIHARAMQRYYVEGKERTEIRRSVRLMVALERSAAVLRYA